MPADCTLCTSTVICTTSSQALPSLSLPGPQLKKTDAKRAPRKSSSRQNIQDQQLSGTTARNTCIISVVCTHYLCRLTHLIRGVLQVSDKTTEPSGATSHCQSLRVFPTHPLFILKRSNNQKNMFITRMGFSFVLFLLLQSSLFHRNA